jgi:biotin carboxylase
MQVIAFTRRGARSSLRRVRGIVIHEVTPPELSIDGCLADIEALVEQVDPDAILPLDDASLWLTSCMVFERATVIGPSPDAATVALDKNGQIEAAAAAGLHVPPTRLVESSEELGRLIWPAVVKPAEAVRADGDRLTRPRGTIAADQDELDAAVPGLGGGPLLVQPYLHGVGEGVFGYVNDDGVASLSAHRRVRMVNPHGSASSACMSIDVDPELESGVRSLIADLDWRGLFMIELLRDDAGIAWFMELNGRAWGSLALARRRGFEYPAWAAQFAMGLPQSPATPSAPVPVTARHLGREIAHLLFVVRGPKSQAITSWPGTWATIKDLLHFSRDDRLYNWNPHRPSVLIGDTIGTLTELAGGRRAKR